MRKETYKLFLFSLCLLTSFGSCKQDYNESEDLSFQSEILLGESSGKEASLWLRTDMNSQTYLVQKEGNKNTGTTPAFSTQKEFYANSSNSYIVKAFPNHAIFFPERIMVLAHNEWSQNGVYALAVYNKQLNILNYKKGDYDQKAFQYTRWGEHKLILSFSGIAEENGHIILLNDEGTILDEFSTDKRIYLPAENIQKIICDNFMYISITNGFITKKDIYGNELWNISLQEIYPNRPSDVIFSPTYTLVSYKINHELLDIKIKLDYYDKSYEIINISLNIETGELY